MVLERAVALNQQLQAAGIPCHGVRVLTIDPLTTDIDFKPEATAEQRAQAEQIVAGFDWRTRRSRSYADLMAQIAALSAADRTKLINAVLADFLREHPAFAQRFGISITGDEPDVS